MSATTRIAILLPLCLVIATGQTYPWFSSANPTCTAPLSKFTWDDGTASCTREGWLVWSAAGGGWGSTISGSSSRDAGMRVDFRFEKSDGSGLDHLDVINDFTTNVSNNFAYPFEMGPGVPYRLDILGLTADAPSYTHVYTGAIRVEQVCPDQYSCMNRRPQLAYLATNGTTPYFNLATDTIWDDELASGFSTSVTVSNGGVMWLQNASFAVVNADHITLTPNVCVYDVYGEQIACKMTDPLAPGQNFGRDLLSWFGQSLFPHGDSAGNSLMNLVISVPGQLKIGVVVYQFTGPAATALRVTAE